MEKDQKECELICSPEKRTESMPELIYMWAPSISAPSISAPVELAYPDFEYID